MNQLSGKADALRRLRGVLNRVPALMGLPHDALEFTKWRRDVDVALARVFGDDSNHVKELKNIRFIPTFLGGEMADSEFREARDRGLLKAQAVLESMIDEVGEWPEDQEMALHRNQPHVDTRKIFVVHGRDEGATDAVARFLEKLQLDPVILSEMPNVGRTIIEKFEAHADVGYAIVLLTSDDRGGLQGEDPRPRARQNVIFELGFFIGKLGREHVCALTKGSPEIPSDYAGVMYIPMDTGSQWKTSLIRELKAARFDVDANKAF